MEQILKTQLAIAIANDMKNNEKDEANIIVHSTEPITVDRIKKDLISLGLKRGDTVLVHTRLSSIGWVNGGPIAVIQALQKIVSDEGTIVMPAQSGGLSDPATWCRPPVPESWWETIRETMPGYDPRYTPTRGIGIIPEIFRTFPNVIRSAHPQVSFAAWGLNAQHLMANHELENGLGEKSPLAKLYNSQAKVLFIGTSYGTNTTFHLAEYRSNNRKEVRLGTSIMADGMNQWVWYKDIDFEDELFEVIGEDFERTKSVTKGKIGNADARLFNIAECVDFATDYLKKQSMKQIL
ncbi:MAG: family N-acetyltransferase [Bacillales bacterium]|jgi:aminoglycoside 3-N-acetyltransferase|nr:family N-acetyltransferase [Bacillales bacterium]